LNLWSDLESELWLDSRSALGAGVPERRARRQRSRQALQRG